jgi:hypothetical protein
MQVDGSHIHQAHKLPARARHPLMISAKKLYWKVTYHFSRDYLEPSATSPADIPSQHPVKDQRPKKLPQMIGWSGAK